MKWLITILCLSPLAMAQETCDSLLKNVQETLDETSTLTRATQVKASFLTLMSNTTRVERSGDELSFTVLEQGGRGPGSQDAELPPEDWLGPVSLEELTCDGHTLELEEDVYHLTLPGDDAAQLKNLTLEVNAESYQVASLKAEVSPPGAPLTARLTTTFREWQLLDN